MVFKFNWRLFFYTIFIWTSVIFTGCSTAADKPTQGSENPLLGGVLRAHLPAPVQSLDPAHLYDSASIEVGMQVFRGLLTLDPQNMEIRPAHAERWEIKNNGRLYIFYLAKGARFHSGKEVTAEDFKYSFERILDPHTASELSGLLTVVKGGREKLAGKTKETTGIRVRGKYVLEMELAEPSPTFLYVLVHPGLAVVDRSAVEKAGTDFGTQAAQGLLAGTGPFRVTDWNNSQIELKANSDYFKGRPYLDKVIYRFIKEETTALNEYRAGNLDLVDRIPPGQLKAVADEFPGQVKTTDLLEVTMYVFNVNKPPFNNKYLRKAINYAVNREEIITALEGQAVYGKGIVPKGIPGFGDDVRGYEYNQAKALEMLDKAGYPRGAGLPVIELKYNTSELNQRVAEIVQAHLKKVGINVRLVNMEPAAYLEDLVAGNSQMFRLSWVADYPDPETFLYPLFASTEVGNANFAFYKNPRFDQILLAARETTDERKRTELYKQAQQVLMDDSVGVVLYYSAQTGLVSPRVKNLYMSRLNIKPLERVWLAR